MIVLARRDTPAPPPRHPVAPPRLRPDRYERDFKGYGVDLTVERDAISAIAAAAAEEKTGARGLVTVLERTFREFKYELPCAGITELGCDAATVADPRSALDRALAKAANATREAVRRADCRRVEASFGRRHAPLTISLAPAAEDFLVAECAHAPDRSLRGLAGASLFDDGRAPARVRREMYFLVAAKYPSVFRGKKSQRRDGAGGTRIFRGEKSRRRRGWDADLPRREVAATGRRGWDLPWREVAAMARLGRRGRVAAEYPRRGRAAAEYPRRGRGAAATRRWRGPERPVEFLASFPPTQARSPKP